jgi:hypothetical protein
MVIDYELLFSDDQAITADAISTNIVDLGVARNIAAGHPVRVLVQVTEAFDNLTNLRVKVQQDTVEAFSSPEDLTEAVLVLADLTVGAKFWMSFVPRNDQRYIGVYYDVTGSSPSAGKITAAIILDEQDNVA